ncbi:dipeptide/oligopeptide/nickel ABC transporter permease/ATP-binding protein [Microbacterium marmarense]|uniref:Dipeptide/oligopeptide/nickel ABC transporter permease/ATP-binding protein n=1 Tax=Microbacterium marmarense TaxID=3122051 RepID=A0ABU8LQY2_9MICO
MSGEVTDSKHPAEPVPTSRSALSIVLRNPIGIASFVFLVLVVAAGIFGGAIAPYGPNFTDLSLANAEPFTSEFVLGGDSAGRDILSRLLYGTRSTLLGSAVMLAVALALGTTTGLIAGYFAGWFDVVGGWAANLLLALPGFVLLVALYAVIGPSILIAMAVFGVLVAPTYYRLVRALVRNVRNELYVDAARVSGLPDTRIVSRHVLRAVRAPIIIQSAFVLGAGIGVQAGLEFLGLGDPTEPSWGGVLQETFNAIFIAPWNLVFPALTISATTLTFALLGNVIRDGLKASGSRAAPLSGRQRTSLATAHSAARTAPARGGAGPIPAGEDCIAVTDLVIGYPTSKTDVREVVHGIDLTLRRGEIHGLVGESGSGKSQTAFALLGILPAEAVVLSGSVTYRGKDLLADTRALREVRGRRIGYVPQEPMSNLDPTLTVGQQLVYGMRATTRVSRRQARQALLELLSRVGINDPQRTFDSYPHEISGGMAQRVLIAGAVASDPEFIVADEPTTALDVTVQAEVLDLLRELQRERNLGMLLVTHNLGVVADICDYVSVMKDGAIVETSSAAELFTTPKADYTRTLLASTLDGAELRGPLARRTEVK